MIKWKLPTIDDSGFLRRRRELMMLLDLSPTEENVNKLAEFLSGFIEGKKVLDQALDLSQKEHDHAVSIICGWKRSVSDPKEGNSVKP